MKPGDVVTCACCGATATANWSSLERAWQEGWALSLTWTHGPHPRVEAARETPEFCIWCHERKMALGAAAPPLYRPKIPAAQPGAVPAGRAPSPAGPLKRFEELAAAFHAETGLLAPGKDQAAAMGSFPTEEERRERWRIWCAARAAAAAPKKAAKPKGQLGLFGGDA